MNETNERLVTLVDEFLDVTRIEQDRIKFNFEENDIYTIIESVLKELKQKVKSKHLLIERPPALSLEPVIMDKEKIRHVIFNFVDNAIKYSDSGSIAIDVTPEENGLVVRVTDQGFGFVPEDEVNFFQKFYRGKNVERTNVNGNGLGIYVCKKFIEAHGGEVWAKSPGLGQGSEFGFWIPLQPKGMEKSI